MAAMQARESPSVIDRAFSKPSPRYSQGWCHAPNVRRYDSEPISKHRESGSESKGVAVVEPRPAQSSGSMVFTSQ